MLPVTSNASLGAVLFIPIFVVLSTRITVLVVPESFTGTSKLAPLVLSLLHQFVLQRLMQLGYHYLK